MRRLLILASLAIMAVAATAVVAPAEARGRVVVGLNFGVPGPYYYGPAYYPAYYPYYYPRPVYYAPAPVVYAAPPAYAPPPAGQVIREGRDSAGNYCREYQSTTTIDGRPAPTYGTACQRPDGSWQIVN